MWVGRDNCNICVVMFPSIFCLCTVCNFIVYLHAANFLRSFKPPVLLYCFCNYTASTIYGVFWTIPQADLMRTGCMNVLRSTVWRFPYRESSIVEGFRRTVSSIPVLGIARPTLLRIRCLLGEVLRTPVLLGEVLRAPVIPTCACACWKRKLNWRESKNLGS